MTATKGSVWRDKGNPRRTVRVLAVYPTVVKYADLIHGKLTATTYTAGHETFYRRFKEAKTS